ncbi:MAG: hypothetical protein JWN95_2410 [Frankiales bacterium]|nr:hypothetical protein [Frankiales bacterium]
MSQPTDSRAVIEYKVPATKLRAGDLVNTSPGNEDDWQQVISVHTAERPGGDGSAGADSDGLADLIAEVGDRYVAVQMTDVAPVDSPVYLQDGAAMAYGLDGSGDVPVTELLSNSESVRTFLYTRFELVTVRS